MRKMYYLYRKHSTRIEVLFKIFEKIYILAQKNQKVFGFGQNFRKTSLLYLKHWRSIDFFLITFEQYVILDKNWKNVISIPKHSNNVLGLQTGMGKSILLQIKFSKRIKNYCRKF